MPDAPAITRDPVAALERHFGFRRFLEGQEEVVSAILAGRDALAIMPTGGGKSLCYQLPALVMEGVTIVVSPLIALMKDQVDGLLGKGIPATMINSTIGPAEQRERIDRMRAGDYKLVYIAPERFRSRSFVAALEGVEIALFAVDEAHCLSQWGHDFRPDYLRLGGVVDRLGRPQTAAFTATATPEVRSDILQHLGLREPYVSLSGFERPNLSLSVTHAGRRADKFDRLRELIGRRRTGIVYCATRKRVEEVAIELAKWRVPAIAYHGGMEDAERERAQDLFIRRERDVVVATNAFGMGIDRPDVRFVAHFDIPGSVEAYYQEAGRAGRDGEPAECELLFNYADTRTQEFFLEGSNPGVETVRGIYEFLRREADEQGEVRLPINEIAGRLGLNNSMQVSATLAMLSRGGWIERHDVPGERMRATRLRNPRLPADEIQLDTDAMEEKERRDRAKLDAMVRFCYADCCRQEFILRYFGQDEIEPCGTCDICRAGGGAERRAGGEEEVTILRKALSGVARTCDRDGGAWRPRFGKGKIVQMLAGGRSQEVLSARLDGLSTYGLLADLGAPYIYELLREAERAELVRTDRSGDYPLLGLTERGEKVMRSGGKVVLQWPKRGASAGKRAARSGNRAAGEAVGKDGGDAGLKLEELGFDEPLFEKLRQLRSEIAAAEGGVPPYVVFGNQTLEFFARLKPTTVEAGMRIRGVGEVKARKYLPAFVEAIRGHVEG